jgi:hypothetical protein
MSVRLGDEHTVKHSVAVGLDHLSMDVKARIAELSDLLGEQLHSIGGVAEDDRLVDLKLAEKRVQAVYLLPLLNKRVILGNAFECEFLHEVDHVRLLQEAVLEVLYCDWESG